MYKTDDGTETAGQLDQLTNLRDQVVRCADHRTSAVGEGHFIDPLIRICEGFHPHLHQGACRIFIPPAEQSIPCLFAGLFPGFGDMPEHDDAPVTAVYYIAVLLSSILSEAPLRGQGLQPSLGHGANG